MHYQLFVCFLFCFGQFIFKVTFSRVVTVFFSYFCRAMLLVATKGEPYAAKRKRTAWW